MTGAIRMQKGYGGAYAATIPVPDIRAHQMQYYGLLSPTLLQAFSCQACNGLQNAPSNTLSTPRKVQATTVCFILCSTTTPGCETHTVPSSMLYQLLGLYFEQTVAIPCIATSSRPYQHICICCDTFGSNSCRPAPARVSRQCGWLPDACASQSGSPRAASSGLPPQTGTCPQPSG